MIVSHRRQKVRRSALSGLSALAMVLTAAACGSDVAAVGTPDKEGLVTIRATVTPGAGSLPFAVAMEKGLFKKHGLKMDVTQGVDFKSYLASLDRQFDVVMAPATTTMAAAVAGLPIKVFGGMEASAEGVVSTPWITKDPDIKSPVDLARKGGTIASATGLTDSTKATWAYLLKDTGLTLDKVKYVTVPFSDMADQLKAGRIDVAQSANGFYEPLLEEGYHIIYENPKDILMAAGGQLPISFIHFLSSANFAENHVDLVQSFQDSIKEAETWISDNDAEARKILQEYTGVSAEFAQQTTLPVWKAAVEASDFEPWVEIYEFGGLLTEPFDPKSLVVEGLK